jgi:Na+/phosphate symporter
MLIFLSLLVCVAGLLVYALASNPKVVELGRLSFFAGLLTFLFQAEKVISFLR